MRPRLPKPHHPPRVALGAAACALALTLTPIAAWAEPTQFSPDNQLSQDVYGSLGLATSGLDEEAAKDTAPYDASSVGAVSTVLTQNDTYIAANGEAHNRYGLRSRLNYLGSYKLAPDDYGALWGGADFWGLGNQPYDSAISSNLSDNVRDVVKAPTDNGFDGIYATSEACDLGSGWDDCVAELRAYGTNTTTMIGRHRIEGGIAIKVMQLDANGNRTEVANLVPRTNLDQVTLDDPWGRFDLDSTGYYNYACAGYVQERDAYFDLAAADVDNDGVDEIFSYSGAYVDKDGIRYALVDMFDRQGDSSNWRHTVTRLDAGQADAYATKDDLKADAFRRRMDDDDLEFLKMAPVVTLAGGNLDRKGGEEIAMTVSAPTDHDAPGEVAKCYLYTWNESTRSLCAVEGLSDAAQGSYIPLNSGSQAMVSANCTFGTFQVPGTQNTVDALLMAGWESDGEWHLSKRTRYTKAAYRYVYFDPEQDKYVVSNYDTKPLGKDAAHIVETATEDADQDDRYVPTLAPFALGCARLRGLRQTVENDQVLFGGEIYEFTLGSGLSTSTGQSISMSSSQRNHNGNDKSKEQVWLGDVAVGNVSGSDNYEESFLAVVGVHRDEEIYDSDDYYWMDVAHFTARYTGSAEGQDDNPSSYSYETGQEEVIREGARNSRNRSYQNRGCYYGTWVSLCLPNVSHRGVQVKYQDMAKYYTAPQVLAMLEDAPYFQDLQDSFHYIVLGGTGFERSQGEGKASSWGIEGSTGVWASATGGFLGRAEIEGELSAHGSYESQNARTLQYGVSYDSHAGEGNKVVVYTVPLVYYYYQVSDPEHPGTWEDLIIPEYLEPTTALVSSEVWDEAAEKVGAPKTGEVFQNVSGDPSTYTSAAMAAGGSNQKYSLSVTRAFTSKDTTTATTSQGATITQSIDTESEAEQTIGYGGGIALKAGGGFGLFASEAMAGIAFDASAGFSNITSSSRGFGFTGAVDNLPEQASGYQFSWRLAVNKSHKDMPDNGEKPSDNQFWIVGYEVDNVSKPKAPAVSGLTATAVTDHSVTLSWDAASLPSGYQYEVAMRDPNGTLSAWQTVDAGSTSFEWGSQEGRQLSPSTSYQFVVRSFDPVTGRRGIDSPAFGVVTLPKGQTLTVSGLDVTEPEGAGRNARVPVGARFVAQESATYAIADDAGATTYYKPYFSWYRKDLRSREAELVGLEDGGGVTYDPAKKEGLRARLDGYLAGELQTTGEGPQVSTLTVPAASVADDGSVWYCNVSVNNVLVSSQPVYLDVTDAVTNAAEDMQSFGGVRVTPALVAGSKLSFYDVSPDSQVTPEDGGVDQDGGSAPETNPASQQGGDASSRSDDAASGTRNARQASEAGSLPQTGTVVSGVAICAIAISGVALVSIGWLVRRRGR